MFENLKKIRETYELTQRDMAKVLEISKSSYNNYETGEQIIPLKRLNDFCNKFHVSIDYVSSLTNKNTYIPNTYKLNKIEIGKRMKQIRLKNKLTQEELALILNTTQSNISSYEQGKTLIITAFLYNFAKHFSISMDYITLRSNTERIQK